MTSFAEVTHHEWIAAPADRVRNQFADLQHHVRANVHPKLRFKCCSGPRSRVTFRLSCLACAA